MRPSPFFIQLLLLFLLLHLLTIRPADCADLRKIGICHGRVADNLPSPSAVVDLLKSNNISKVRLFLPDPAVLPAFKRSGIELTIGVPNENLTYLSSQDTDAVVGWLNSNIFSFVGADQVRYIVVGNEVLFKDPFYTPHVMPAIWNVHRALQALGLDGRIKLSSAHALTVLKASYPPSAGQFDPSILPIMRSMLGFLAQTGAPLMVNMYPFISYVGDPANIPLSYALFGSDAAAVHDGGIEYTNLFDATVDAVVAAMEREGFPGVPVAVMETGWPTAGHDAATPSNAAAYNRKIMERLSAGVGTPKRPGDPVEVFLFDLYDEDGKKGNEFEKHFGIFRLDGSKAYDISFA